MSLSSSIQLASNSLKAAQIGLQVVGQNIANANTPGYIREEVVLEPAPTQRLGGLLLGMGVEVRAVIQKLDTFLEERLRGATSERNSAESQEETYLQLEGIIGELSDTDLSTSMNNFFNSISEVLNQPESVSVRNLAVLQGQTLAGDINRLTSRVKEIRSDVNGRIINIADDINRLTEEITTLNIRISQVEAGASESDAVGLRDQRLVALSKLSELINLNVNEQPSGGVAIFSGGDFLVLEGTRREVKVVETSFRGLPVAEIRLATTDSPIDSGSGELGGLVVARDEILGGTLESLDEFAATLIFEFNKVYSSGQGLNGFDSVTGDFSVDQTDLTLDEAGLRHTPSNGSFEVLVQSKQTGLTQTHPVLVDLNGLDDDSTLDDIIAALDAIDGISAVATPTGKLQIQSDSPDTQFSFANDTSGLLAALGINTFFSGSTASDISANQVLIDDPAKFAASGGGIGVDTEVAIQLASFMDRQLESANNSTLSVLYDRLTGGVTQGSTVARSVAEGFRFFEQSLNGQKLATSGVSLDEEAVRMITFQRAYQASARYIATISELMEVLVNL